MTTKEAIANLNHIYGIVSSDIQRSLDIAIKALEERPHGEWIFKKFDEETGISNSDWCPFCGKAKAQVYDNFCGNCGAQLKGV